MHFADGLVSPRRGTSSRRIIALSRQIIVLPATEVEELPRPRCAKAPLFCCSRNRTDYGQNMIFVQRKFYSKATLGNKGMHRAIFLAYFLFLCDFWQRKFSFNATWSSIDYFSNYDIYLLDVVYKNISVNQLYVTTYSKNIVFNKIGTRIYSICMYLINYLFIT